MVDKDLTEKELHDLEDLLIEASLKSALNMGVPDYFICGECGERYSYEGFLEHPCVTNAKN